MSISRLVAYDPELLFRDLADPCRDPSLRNKSSLEIFTREGTQFQLEKKVREKIIGRSTREQAKTDFQS